MQTKAATTLHAYWTERRGERPAPLRSEIEPAHLAGILPDVFILENERSGPRVRLAGTRFCAQFGRELKGARFAELFTMAGRERILRAADRVMSECTPVTAHVAAEGGHWEATEVEIVLFPLASRDRTVDRIIGTFAPLPDQNVPLAAFQSLALRSVTPLSHGHMTNAPGRLPAIQDPASVMVSRQAEAGAAMRRILHLRIFEGGRQ